MLSTPRQTALFMLVAVSILASSGAVAKESNRYELSSVTGDSGNNKILLRGAKEADNDTEDRGLLAWVRLQYWLETGRSKSYVKQSLELEGLEGAALRSAPNFIYYDDFVFAITAEFEIYSAARWDNRRITASIFANSPSPYFFVNTVWVVLAQLVDADSQSNSPRHPPCQKPFPAVPPVCRGLLDVGFGAAMESSADLLVLSKPYLREPSRHSFLFVCGSNPGLHTAGGDQTGTVVARFLRPSVVNGLNTSTISTLTAQYSDTAFYKLIVRAKENPNTKDLALKIQEEQMQHWLNTGTNVNCRQVAAPEFILPATGEILRQLPIQNDRKCRTCNTRRGGCSDGTHQTLLARPLFNTWARYIKAFDSKLDVDTIMVEILTRKLGDAALAASIVAAKTEASTRGIETKLEFA
ncbi:hypothetical protein ON010_g8082 [Phytophthora cinnamomi]|nr:hypothetical protein ON010_g8082 [Phytophthora cinnamomi]